MTILEAIDRVRATKPSGYGQHELIGWLSTIEGIIKREIVDTHEGGEAVSFDGFGDGTDMETELIAGAPYDVLYLRYLEAQVDYANGEYAKYNNSMTAFVDAYDLYKNAYNRAHMPKGRAFKYY